MKKLTLILVALMVFIIGCAPSMPSQDNALTKNGDQLDLDGAKLVMLSSNTTDAGRNEEDVINQINNYLMRDIDIISFSRFYDPETSRLIRCEIIYREIPVTE